MNLLGGVMLASRRPFKVGDKVKSGARGIVTHITTALTTVLHRPLPSRPSSSKVSLTGAHAGFLSIEQGAISGA
jgi:small-conductance mechanosensitive channel